MKIRPYSPIKKSAGLSDSLPLLRALDNQFFIRHHKLKPRSSFSNALKSLPNWSHVSNYIVLKRGKSFKKYPKSPDRSRRFPDEGLKRWSPPVPLPQRPVPFFLAPQTPWVHAFGARMACWPCTDNTSVLRQIGAATGIIDTIEWLSPTAKEQQRLGCGDVGTCGDNKAVCDLMQISCYCSVHY